MELNPQITFLAVVVLLSYTTQAISGFGSTIIAVSLGLHFFTLELLVPVLMALDLLLNGYLAGRYRDSIQWTELMGHIIPTMSVGAVAGVVLLDLLAGTLLQRVFALFVMALSGYELVKLWPYRPRSTRSQEKLPKPLPYPLQLAFLLLGGLIHGLYASGGPMVVYVTARLPWDKGRVRATLAALWSGLSLVMLAAFAWQGQFTPQVGGLALILVPMVLAGLILGDRAHRRMDERRFRLFLYALLLFAGALLLLS